MKFERATAFKIIPGIVGFFLIVALGVPCIVCPHLFWLHGLQVRAADGATIVILSAYAFIIYVLLLKKTKRVLFAICAPLIFLGGLAPLVVAMQRDFEPPPPAVTTASMRGSDRARIVFFGDVGRASAIEKELGAQIEGLDSEYPITTAFLLGDNIYGHQSYDTAFEQRIRIPLASLFERNIPLRAVLGSHDYSGHYAEEELADPRFGMEGRRYFKWQTGNNLLSVFLIDSETYSRDRNQVEWLVKGLSEDRSKWTLIACHGAFSASKIAHGESPTFRNALAATFRRSRPVDVFINGKSHVYERCVEPSYPTTFITVGSSGKAQSVDWPENPNRIMQESKKGVMVLIDVDAKSLSMKALGSDGTVVDSVLLSESGN